MNRMRRGKLPLPKEELEAEMFEYIIAELERAGFEHYEISNFSKPGFESRLNLMYWDNAEYYGIIRCWGVWLCQWVRYKTMVRFVIISVQLRKAMRVLQKNT